MFDFPLPDYSHMTPGLLLVYAIAGVFGALVRVAWLDKPLKGFYRDDKGGLHMGFFAEVIIAVAVAISIDGHPVRAGIVAVFAPFILDMIKDFIIGKGPALLAVVFGGPATRAKPDESEEEDGRDNESDR